MTTSNEKTCPHGATEDEVCPECLGAPSDDPDDEFREVTGSTMSGCLHNKNTSAQVRIDYMEDTGRYMCDVQLKCEDCGQPFRFLGLPLGLNMNGATMDVDGLTARLAIAPKDRTLHPLEGLQGFGVKLS